MSDPCTGRKGTAASHCWHYVMRETVVPPQRVEQCCFCGQQRYYAVMQPTPSRAGHGPFMPEA